MAGDTVITVVGNLTADPELRFTPSGAAVANFTIASTPRTFDRQTNEFKDGETLFLRSSVWREAAENVAETLTKGMRVVAQGRLKSRSFQTKEGENRTVMELDVDEVGPSLRYASAKVTRNSRGGNNGGFGGNQQGGFNGNSGNNGGFGGQPAQQPQQPQQPSQGGWGAPAAPANDPWAQPQGGGNNGGWGNLPNDSEPPF